MSDQLPQPLLVDEPTAARMLGDITVRTLFNLRKAGLPFVRVGSRIMYRPADLAAWIDRQVVTADAKPAMSIAG